jgi:hypothetical protein
LIRSKCDRLSHFVGRLGAIALKLCLGIPPAGGLPGLETALMLGALLHKPLGEIMQGLIFEAIAYQVISVLVENF